MATGFENSISDPIEILSILRLRKKPHIEKLVSASSIELARKKAELEKEDGWEVLRENISSIRMKKQKPIDKRLEDDVWCILAQMGFDEVSKDRQFKISVGPSIPERQIDVFAKDKEAAIFIECTATEETKSKSLSSLIEKIVAIRKNVFDKATKHYGHDSKLQMKWGIATRNIEWNDADEKKCIEENIFILKDSNINYYTKLANHLKHAAKYQLLAHIFQNEKIKGLSLTVPATKGKIGKILFFNFLIKPHDLLKIAYISHKKGDDIDDFDTYQRMLQPTRLKKIGAYIDSGGQFPTNIVVNIKTDKRIRFDKIKNIGTSSYGQLYLPSQYASAWIIDGQHRLYGYSYSKRSSKKEEDTTVFPVLAYVNKPSEQEAQMFIDINCEQVKVSRNLLNEIYAGLKWDSPIFKERIDGLCSRIVIKLSSISTSPVFERVITTNTKKTHYRCLTLNSFVDGLKENKFFGEEKAAGTIPGPLSASYSSDLKSTLEKAMSVIEYYLGIYKKNIEKHWLLGDAPGGFLCTNNGIRALLRVLREVFDHITYEKGLDFHTLKPEDLFDDIEKYTSPLVDYFTKLRDEEYLYFRNRTALKGVYQNTMQMLTVIHRKYSEFHPAKLENYLEKIDEEGTEESRKLIDEISFRMYNHVIDKLIGEFGEDWWYEGVPEKVRVQCRDRQEREKGKKAAEQYLLLKDYHSIAHKNWLLFQKYFTISKDGGKDKKLAWVVELSNIRNITHHREKWPCEKNQVNFVREVHKHVMDYFK